MNAPLAKWLLTLCSVITACAIYGMTLASLITGDFKPAILGPLLGFTFGAALVIFTAWRPTVGIRKASGTEPRNWPGFLFWLWWFLAFMSASVLLWVAGMVAIGGSAVAVFALMGRDAPTSPAAPIMVLAWFGGAVWISARCLPLAIKRS